ncbi:MAG: hypothetical protein KC800_28240, partial [Candidatus Eremiobacteraeota bacterium]|nr:hypothetical protein [Candidatus Eremiobacteraeota bacterium]
SGYPIVASGWSGFQYPPRILAHLFLSPGAARTSILFVHSALMALAMYGWLLSRRLHPGAAGLGGIIWMLNGYVAGWLEFDHVVTGGCYLPMMLYCFDRGLNGDGRRWWALLAIAGALCLHTGHLQICFALGLILITYAAIRISFTRRWKALIGFGFSGVGVVMMSAPTVFPFLELLKLCQRPHFSLEELQRMAPSLSTLLLSLLNPDITGNPTHGFLVNRCMANLIYPEFACYFGLIPLWLTGVAVWKRKHAKLPQGEILVWAGIGVLSILFAAATPVYRLVLLILPPLQQAIPSRSLMAFAFVGVLLASVGADLLLENQEQVVRKAPIFGGLMMALVLLPLAAAYLLYSRPETLLGVLEPYLPMVKIPPRDPVRFQTMLLDGLKNNYVWNPQMWLPFLSGLVLVGWKKLGRSSVLMAVVALELLVFTMGFNTTVSPDEYLPSTPGITFLQQQEGRFRTANHAAGFYDTLTPYGLDLPSGYESLVPARYGQTLAVTQPSGTVSMRTLALEKFDHALYSAMNVRFLMQAPIDLPAPEGWDLVYDKEVRIFENPNVLPRAFTVGQAKVFQDPLQARSYLASAEFRPEQEVVLETPPVGPIEESAGQGDVTIETYQPDTVVLRAKMAGAGFLVLGDSYYPGWVCRSNGQETPIYVANGLMRAVYLTGGEHRVEFRFEPPRYYLGLKLAVFGLVVSILLILAPFRGKVRLKEEANEDR